MTAKKQKGLGLRRAELADAERLIRTSRIQVEAGEGAFSKVLSVQLRALLHSSNMSTPLLFHLADIVNLELKCIDTTFDALPGHATSPEGIPVGILKRWVSIPIQGTDEPLLLFRDWLTHRSSSTSDELEAPDLCALDLIRSHADRLGGAHYDLALAEHEERYRRISLTPDGRLNLFDQLLVHTSEVAEFHARRVLKEIDQVAFALLDAVHAEGQVATLTRLAESAKVKFTFETSVSRGDSPNRGPSDAASPP